MPAIKHLSLANRVAAYHPLGHLCKSLTAKNDTSSALIRFFHAIIVLIVIMLQLPFWYVVALVWWGVHILSPVATEGGISRQVRVTYQHAFLQQIHCILHVTQNTVQILLHMLHPQLKRYIWTMHIKHHWLIIKYYLQMKQTIITNCRPEHEIWMVNIY